MVLQWQKGLDFLCRWEEDWNKDCVGSDNNVQRDACIEKPEEEIWASGLLWSHKGNHWCGESCINWCFDEDQIEAMDTECQLISPQYSQNQCQKSLWQSEQEEFVQFQVHLVTRQIVGGTFLVSANQEAIGLPKNIVNKMKRVIGSDEERCQRKRKMLVWNRKSVPSAWTVLLILNETVWTIGCGQNAMSVEILYAQPIKGIVVYVCIMWKYIKIDVFSLLYWVLWYNITHSID